MKVRTAWTGGFGAVAVLAAAVLVPTDAGARSVKQPLHPTVVDQNAQGRVVVSIHRAGKSMQGKMLVVGHHLAPSSTFGVSVAGVRIGKLTTNAAGAGAARFSSQPTGHGQFLGVDPLGTLVEVSDDQGEDVMETEMPDDTPGAGEIQCCVADDDGAECEEKTPDECTAEGGTAMGAGSCFPNPCPTTPPSPEIQCCQPNSDDGPECEEQSAAECSASNGINMGPGSCDPNPCAPTAPPGIVSCCIAQGDQGEQEGEPHTGPPECQQLTGADCADEGGTVSTAASCAPNPCVTSPSGAFLDFPAAAF